MLWEIEIRPRDGDPERARVCEDYDLLTHARGGADLITGAARGYLLEGDLSRDQARRLADELLVDPVVETGRLGALNELLSPDLLATVLLKPGVMDPTALSVVDAARDLGVPVESARTFRRYYGPPLPEKARDILFRKVLANEAIEQVVPGPLALEHLTVGAPYHFVLRTVPLRDLDDAALEHVSRDGQLSLSLAEMRTIQAHFREQGRDPTDVELETIAQTWSEHCSHKTLKGVIDFREGELEAGEIREGEIREGEAWEGEAPAEPRPEARQEPRPPGSAGVSPSGDRRYSNLLKETIFAATQEVRRLLGPDDWCVSVFEDNAGVVRFDDKFHVCFKVETHNRPSAIEPYGGANTGLGGVIRDPLGTGLGAKPVCNTDVFCFGSLHVKPEELPPGVLHPLKVMKGVVAGVRDYGNRMGIPTVNGAVCFDERYLANPLVFCGTVGLIPVDRATKAARPGDLIVAVGGRTGRDGIHGATFSSAGLTSESEKVSGGAVQIGNAIAEKKLLDVILQARDADLYHAITDCGAGGFSSAVGEMGADLGACVDLDKAPLKYAGLSHTEIWISESQERMILAVPAENWERLHRLCAGEDVEATVIGRFEPTGRLRLRYEGQEVGDLAMRFLHDGRPEVVRKATCSVRTGSVSDGQGQAVAHASGSETLRKILSAPNVCSKEWIVRQYDHEVQGGSVIKPLVGAADDGPGDAAVVAPVLGSWNGFAVGCGLNPRLGDLDAYQMAAHAIDEAVRNVVTVGADPARIALLDNFCWGNTDRPEVLGSLVRAAEACRDVAVAYRMPFISGKDSLKNEYHSGGPEKKSDPLNSGGQTPFRDRHIVIPPTLLISALGLVRDVRQCVTMDLKEPGNLLYLVGTTKPEMGGSHYHLVQGLSGGRVTPVDTVLAPKLFRRLHEAISRGLVRACHDLSEGGLAVAVAEMAFAGGIGAGLTQTGAPGLTDDVALFAESPTRFLIEVRPEKTAEVESHFGSDVPLVKLGQTVKEPRLRIAGAGGEWVVWAALGELKEAWQKPLRW